MRLQPYYKTPEKEKEDFLIANERAQVHYDEIMSNFPELDIQCHLSVDTSFGTMITRAFVHCPKEISPEQTRLMVRWAKRFFGNIERNFRKDQGTFFWQAKQRLCDQHGEYEFLFFIEGTHPLTCEIKKVKKEVEVFESVCSPEEAIQ